MSDAESGAPKLTVLDMWEKYTSYTRNASEITRSLCFAGLALIWLLRQTEHGKSSIPQLLQIGALLIVLAMFLDLAQYVVGAIRVKRVATHFEKLLKTNPETPVLYPDKHPIPMERLLYSKIACVVVAYVFLLWHLALCVLRGELPGGD